MVNYLEADLSEAGSMPLYEYTCKDCKKDFTRIMSLSEYEAGNVKCPECGSGNVEQKPASFFAVTSKKS